MEESIWFCNEWECKFRENKIHKVGALCDKVWNGECPYDDEFYKSLRK